MGLGPGVEDPDHEGADCGEEDEKAAAEPPMPPGVIRIGGGNPDSAGVASDEANAQAAKPELAASMMQVCETHHR